MKIFKQLSKKGYKHYYESTIEELDSMDKYNLHLYSEIMQVVIWLYEKHGIWIVPEMISELGQTEPKFYGRIRYFEDEFVKQENTENYNSPTESYLAAIEYTLKNLI